jgi:predicted  nucleic acid-binding Zn-ribbon protein
VLALIGAQRALEMKDIELEMKDIELEMKDLQLEVTKLQWRLQRVKLDLMMATGCMNMRGLLGECNVGTVRDKWYVVR